ncbi:MAG: bifunctional UDP-N-acetylglucosamine diphosphorylase/glucosamine-1-phosphate N-acetyltransferase GlmU [Anaerolineaceae bacterium]|nr:bifunctional UDP-N-acetylglucosamine diphosphorylase/glucosamine-1-phosphate N-acetyltransferase GlmU [Anaerolineaceae bacterium]
MANRKPKIDVVILAAGMGTRMKSDIPKVLHPLLGKPMVEYIFDAVRDICADPPLVVVGSQADLVMESLGSKARYVVQEPQLGTAHAVQCARDVLRGKSDIILVANSDFPLITAQTYALLVKTHQENDSKLTLSTVVSDEPRGFGRILRDGKRRIIGIVEDKAATPEQKKITELNSNPYCFDAKWLWGALDQVKKSTVGEYYLTDLVKIAASSGQEIGSIEIKDRRESIGINNRVHLAEATKIVQQRINRKWMLAGVTMIDPDRVFIDDTVTLGRDTVLYPEVYLRGESAVGEGCQLGPSVIMEDTVVGNHCKLLFAMLESAKVEDDVDMGPFGHLRRGAHLGNHVHLGNFGEVKNSYLAPGVKMGHFSYIGDAHVGRNVNIGAGTITCNFDGEGKHKTEIGEGAFIGSDTMLVAPVKIGAGAKTGAGAVVTHNVPDGSVVVGVPAKEMESKQERD